jgi:hypothetical protein
MVFKLGSIREAANSSVELAVDYKNFLDKKYGKDNYVFISIGVSPSLITKADAHNFSSIAHLPVLTIGDTKMTNDRLTLHKEIVPKLFNFAVMDKLDEMGLLKENPKNLSAL